ncbi:MAG: hypothetical protein NkDv07_0301 [Candidatus Improbicoccus devescovinae]|nr:MAG: hypothetical protein NkDv07_0301 [Candidatus Improbicoccus devescovinae]
MRNKILKKNLANMVVLGMLLGAGPPLIGAESPARRMQAKNNRVAQKVSAKFVDLHEDSPDGADNYEDYNKPAPNINIQAPAGYKLVPADYKPSPPPPAKTNNILKKTVIGTIVGAAGIGSLAIGGMLLADFLRGKKEAAMAKRPHNDKRQQDSETSRDSSNDHISGSRSGAATPIPEDPADNSSTSGSSRSRLAADPGFSGGYTGRTSETESVTDLKGPAAPLAITYEQRSTRTETESDVVKSVKKKLSNSVVRDVISRAAVDECDRIVGTVATIYETHTASAPDRAAYNLDAAETYFTKCNHIWPGLGRDIEVDSSQTGPYVTPDDLFSGRTPSCSIAAQVEVVGEELNVIADLWEPGHEGSISGLPEDRYKNVCAAVRSGSPAAASRSLQEILAYAAMLQYAIKELKTAGKEPSADSVRAYPFHLYTFVGDTVFALARAVQEGKFKLQEVTTGASPLDPFRKLAKKTEAVITPSPNHPAPAEASDPKPEKEAPAGPKPEGFEQALVDPVPGLCYFGCKRTLLDQFAYTLRGVHEHTAFQSYPCSTVEVRGRQEIENNRCEIPVLFLVPNTKKTIGLGTLNFNPFIIQPSTVRFDLKRHFVAKDPYSQHTLEVDLWCFEPESGACDRWVSGAFMTSDDNKKLTRYYFAVVGSAGLISLYGGSDYTPPTLETIKAYYAGRDMSPVTPPGEATTPAQPANQAAIQQQEKGLLEASRDAGRKETPQELEKEMKELPRPTVPQTPSDPKALDAVVITLDPEFCIKNGFPIKEPPPPSLVTMKSELEFGSDVLLPKTTQGLARAPIIFAGSWQTGPVGIPLGVVTIPTHAKAAAVQAELEKVYNTAGAEGRSSGHFHIWHADKSGKVQPYAMETEEIETTEEKRPVIFVTTEGVDPKLPPEKRVADMIALANGT